MLPDQKYAIGPVAAIRDIQKGLGGQKFCPSSPWL